MDTIESKIQCDMTYTSEEIIELNDAYASVHEKYLTLALRYIEKDFKNEKAHEYAEHGFARRLRLLAHCIKKIFEELPPDKVQPLDFDGTLDDAAIYLQAFIFHVFGCIDDLAHIWVHGKGIKGTNGKKIPNSWVGLGRNNKYLRETLSPEFKEHLENLNSWFIYLEDFRHALAHRIPPYVPPYVESQETTYFCPIMLHSIGEKGKPVFFHAQMITDFNTVEEIAQKLLQEFN